jgi:hypothetical protein
MLLILCVKHNIAISIISNHKTVLNQLSIYIYIYIYTHIYIYIYAL